MNLGLEYLVRSGIIRDFIKFPCSLFLQRAKNKKVVVLTQRGNNRYVQHWNIFLCHEGQALPPMTEYRVDDFFKNPYVLPVGYRPLLYTDQPIPARANSRAHPMDGYLYEEFYNTLLCSWGHTKSRHFWLWTAFKNTYNVGRDLDGLQTLTWVHYFAVTNSEANIIKDKHPRKWRFWKMWLKYLHLSCDGAPAELAFTAV